MFYQTTYRLLEGQASVSAYVPARDSCVNPGKGITIGPFSALSEFTLPADQTASGFFNPDGIPIEIHQVDTSGSWAAIKKSGVIKMTPLLHKSQRTRNFLVRWDPSYKAVLGPRKGDYVYGGSPPVFYGVQVRAWGIQEEATLCDFDYLTQVARVPYYTTKTDIETETQYVINQLIAKTAAEYDLLTDLGELPSTLKLAFQLISTAINPLRAYKNFKVMYSKLSKAEKAKLPADILAKKWLEVQYGVMPVIYSINDILKVIDRKDITYRTVRVKRNITPERPSKRSGNYLFDIDDRSISIRGTAKLRFSEPSARFYSAVGLNPLRTAWNLIPYSLVVDWFIDVSAFFLSLGGRLGLNVPTEMCVSIRTKGVIRTYAHRSTDTLKNVTYPKDDLVSVADVCSPTQPNVVFETRTITIPESTEVVKEVSYNDYERRVIKFNDAKLTLSPQLQSWKRQLSALALAWVSLQTILRRLK